MDDDLMDLAAQLLLVDEDDAESRRPLGPSSTTTSDSDEPPATQADGTACVVVSVVGRIPGTPRDDERQRRRRRRSREAVARHRLLRRQRTEQLQQQTTELELLFSRLLVLHKHVDSAAISTTPLQRYQARFTELVRSREALLREKRDLVGKMAVQDHHARTLQSIVEKELGTSRFPFPKTPGGVWLQYDEDEAPFYYEPVSDELCRATIALGLEKMAELRRLLPRPSAMSTPNLIGWTSERTFIRSAHGHPVMLFRFSRHVAKYETLATMDQVVERSWKIVTTPDVATRPHASPVRRQFVQQVHDDIIIMIRNAPELHGTWRSRYLGLYHKIRRCDKTDDDARLGDRAMIVSMLMNRAPRESGGDLSGTRHSGSWLKDGCSLLRFTERPATPSNWEAGLDVEYVGHLECLNMQHGEHMWTVLCLLLLRWERRVFSDQLLLR